SWSGCRLEMVGHGVLQIDHAGVGSERPEPGHLARLVAGREEHGSHPGVPEMLNHVARSFGVEGHSDHPLRAELGDSVLAVAEAPGEHFVVSGTARLAEEADTARRPRQTWDDVGHSELPGVGRSMNKHLAVDEVL